jgi:hypothetical protein
MIRARAAFGLSSRPKTTGASRLKTEKQFLEFMK